MSSGNPAANNQIPSTRKSCYSWCHNNGSVLLCKLQELKQLIALGEFLSKQLLTSVFARWKNKIRFQDVWVDASFHQFELCALNLLKIIVVKVNICWRNLIAMVFLVDSWFHNFYYYFAKTVWRIGHRESLRTRRSRVRDQLMCEVLYRCWTCRFCDADDCILMCSVIVCIFMTKMQFFTRTNNKFFLKCIAHMYVCNCGPYR
jgi:hypothetical protein